jgi:hypothetical protein
VSIDLYRFYDRDGGLLYIGISLHAAQRASQHRHGQPWWPEVARMDVESVSGDRADAEAAERAAILAEKPRYNVVHNHHRVRETASISAATNADGSPQTYPLVGSFVLTPDPDDGWPLCECQGVISELVEPGLYLVSWFSWLTGTVTHSECVELRDMNRWHFFYDHDAFLDAADRASYVRDRRSA